MIFYTNFMALILMFFSTVSWSQPLATERYQFIEPDSLRYIKGKLALSYLTTCHKPQHTVLARIDAAGVLRVGILSRQSGSMCASMPKLVTEVLDYLDLSKVKEIRKISQYQIRSSLRVVPLNDLRVLPGKPEEASGLEAVYQSRCGKYEGLLVKRNSGSRLSLAFIESVVPMRGNATCNFKQHRKSFSFINPAKNHQVKVGLLAEWSLPQRAYDIRFAQIDNRTLQISNGSISFNYKKSCKEVPLGIAVSDYSGTASSLTIGMVVARFYNRSCELGEKKWSVSKYTSLKFELPSSLRLKAFSSTRKFSQLKLKPVLTYRNTSKDDDPKLKVSYLGGCSANRAVVYGYSLNSKRSMAILVPNSKFPCKKTVKKVSLIQPLAQSDKGAKLRYYPLQLLGSAF